MKFLFVLLFLPSVSWAITASTFNPQKWEDVEASKVTPNTVGISGSCTLNSTTTIDTLIPDDNIIRGIELITTNQLFGDKVSISVIDKDAVYAPANTVLATPVTDFYISADAQRQAKYDGIVPKKIPGGTYFRVTCTSTGLLLNVDIKINLIMLKVLI